MAFTPKPLKYHSLPGLSQMQLDAHYRLYLGYVNKTNEIREKLALASRQEASPIYSRYRELKVEETYSLNGIKLHELYFHNLGGGGQPDGEMSYYLNRSFGSVSNWKDDFLALGLSSRGWGVMAFDLDERELRNFLLDAHNKGSIQRAIPVLVLDVYEHAYFIDYQTDRRAYLNAFFHLIDWNVVNCRLHHCLQQHIGVCWP